MFRDTNFEHSSEAADFKYEPKESDSVLDQIEDMRDEHVSEAPDRAEDKGVDQAPDGMNDLLLQYRDMLRTADLTDQDTINELHKIEAQVAAIDESQAETLKEEFMNKKIE